MSLPYPNPLYQDGSFTTASPQGLPVSSSPIPATTAEYVINQDYVVAKNSYLTPLAQGTPHPDYPTYYLVTEGPKQDMGGGLIKFTRTYAAVPASYSEFETFGYSFIGLLGLSGINVPTVQGRGRTPWTVASRLQNDFFLVPSTVTDPIYGTRVTITVPGDILKVWAMQYVYQVTFNGVLYGGILFPTDALSPAGSTGPTIPNLTTYQAMIADALSNSWKATPTVQIIFPTQTGAHYAGTIDAANSILGGQIVAEDSRVTRWMGPIWVRSTRYVLAH